MPSSQIENISTITQWIAGLNPRSILDVGVGFGKYGVLAREYTDIRNGRYWRKDWKTIIDGIEIFTKYKNPCWDIYNSIFEADAREMVQSLRNYEVILLCDILEHFEKGEALALLHRCRTIATKAVIVSTPHGKYEQGAAFGNEHERHLSEWFVCDFDQADSFESSEDCLSAIYLKEQK